ncbi:MAG: peptidoglycan DD-metalloendopeptidase family protein [Campylobacterales bacterium]
MKRIKGVLTGILKGGLALLLIGGGPTVGSGATLKRTQQKLKQTEKRLSYYNSQLGRLKRRIEKRKRDLKWIEVKLAKTQKLIKKLEAQLKNSSSQIEELQREKGELQRQLREIEGQIAKFLSENYYLEAQQLKGEISITDLINSALYRQISKEYSKKVAQLVGEERLLQQKIQKINRKIRDILVKKRKLERQKAYLAKLQKRREKELAQLKAQKEEYWKKIQELKQKQAVLQQLLERLKIVRKNPKQLSKAPRRFRHLRFTSPVRGVVIQRFGSYMDPLYHIRIYNNSIVIKTRPNAKVRAVERGEVVYIGEYGGKKVLFIKHPNGVFSIYSNLSKISPLLKKGSKVKRREVIARVKDSLEFGMSYKENYLNPLRYIKIYQ